ncbi:MAG: trypsin-like peptidase domain-containing protein [Bacillota bacterium]|nr:trypsin-like peptidase domain-containing protein [Bacillota bacterium]
MSNNRKSDVDTGWTKMNNSIDNGDAGFDRDYDYKEIQQSRAETGSAELQDSNKYGAIRFRNNKRKTKIKMALKGVSFVLIASLSGGITAAVMVNRMRNSSGPYTYSPNGGMTLLEPTGISQIPKSNISRVAEAVRPTVVGISNNADSFFGGTVDKFMGSGVIFDSKGYIVTNYHVIDGVERIMVKIPGVTDTYKADLVGSDKTSDLAVLKINSNSPLPAAKLGDSKKVRVGDTAIAIGNPLGDEFAGTVTAGIISSSSRQVSAINPQNGQEVYYNVLQTDAAINQGSSGGPLCNENGEVIGIVSLRLNQQDVEGMGFAICSDEVIKVINEITQTGSVKRPYIGVYGATAQGSNGADGVYIYKVYEGTGAEEAGIKPCDIIVELNGKKIKTKEDFNAIEEVSKIGDVLKCKIWRDGKEIEFNVKVSQRPS